SNETAAYRDRTRCTWYPPPTARCHPGSVFPLSAEVSLARECPVAWTLLLALRDVPPRLAIRPCRMPRQPLDARDNLPKERPRQAVSAGCKVKCRIGRDDRQHSLLPAAVTARVALRPPDGICLTQTPPQEPASRSRCHRPPLPRYCFSTRALPSATHCGSSQRNCSNVV